MIYFKDKTKNLYNNFKISLANLFIELNDKIIANQIYSRFLNHPLQLLSENIFIALQFVVDLTNSYFDPISAPHLALLTKMGVKHILGQL